ncbi:hypothetical protein NKJ36_28020 [Mesorhizobium sp. M0142]|uniref:hypothetical protein n=1 Tax=Mesorhizobium sp. M0142 TaxID=2956894 RepID=UPI003335A797
MKKAVQGWKAKSNASTQRRFDEQGNNNRAAWSARGRADYKAKAAAAGRAVRSYTRLDAMTDVDRANRERVKEREKKQRYRAKKKADAVGNMKTLPLYGRF